MHYLTHKIHQLFSSKKGLIRSVKNTSNFTIGEIVVCINDKPKWQSLGGLKKNEMYTIIGFNPTDGGLILKEVKSFGNSYRAYANYRFRKVDTSFFDEVMAFITTPNDIQIYEFDIVQLN